MLSIAGVEVRFDLMSIIALEHRVKNLVSSIRRVEDILVSDARIQSYSFDIEQFDYILIVVSQPDCSCKISQITYAAGEGSYSGACFIRIEPFEEPSKGESKYLQIIRIKKIQADFIFVNY